MMKVTPQAARVLAVPVLAGLVAWASSTGTAAAVMSRTALGGTAMSGTVRGILNGVAVTSSSNAWAVGDDGSGESQIVRWNGAVWKQVPSPNPSPVNILAGVAAISASNAWAVGSYVTGQNTGGQPFIVHWNGSVWKQVPSPNLGNCGTCPLNGVAASSASNAWAVGYTDRSTDSRSLILHWNGAAWTQVPSPNPSQFSDVLYGVAATSASNAWAVGSALGSGTSPVLIVHWNGTAWTKVPTPGLNGTLYGIAATSASNAWAVGSLPVGGPLIVHWNGIAWKKVPSPVAPSGTVSFLAGVAATSASNAWAVGIDGSHNTLIAHWNGIAWTQVPSPDPSAAQHFLNGVAATSSTDAWTVGNTAGANGGGPKILIAHWNGSTWQQDEPGAAHHSGHPGGTPGR